jgi:amino-acid N-acetyltransferase
MTANAGVERARPEDLAAILELLERHRLPPDGLRDHIATTLVARRAGSVIGTAALEIYEDGALLRSVAVAPEAQGHGIGRQLTSAAVRWAHELQAPAIYLLTTTAARYFPRLGFERIERADVPAGVRTSVEFASACPSTAIVMRRMLQHPQATE